MPFKDIENNLTKLPGYKSRPAQQHMAEEIEAALAHNEGLLVQGPVGIGKSLAGMIPMIEHARNKGARVVVATSTIALMEQYVNSDVPLLEEHSGLDFTWGMVKGKGRYVCQVNLHDAEVASKVPNISDLRKELEAPGQTGDFEHLTTPLTEIDKMHLATSASDCPGASECLFGATCFAEGAKSKALQSDVVITNTAMLMADLELRKGTGGAVNVLGDYDAVLVDEGHLLESSASSSLGVQITQRGLEALVTRVHGFLQSHHSKQADPITLRAREYLDAVENTLLEEESTDELNKVWFVQHAEPFLDLISILTEMQAAVKMTQAVDEKAAIRRKILMKQCSNLSEELPNIILGEDWDLVRWLETKKVGRGDKSRVVWTLKTAPVDVSKFLRDWLINRVPTVIMSGTLAVKDRNGNDDFSYIRRSLGAEGPNELAVESPFDYENNQLVWTPPDNAPNPKDYHNWLGWSQNMMLELIDADPTGGALVLFTSRKDMEAVYESLAERLEDRERNVYMQGLDYNNKQLAQFFKDDVTSVLFGLASFGTGFDAKGDTLRTVIISKLPFDVPTDPIFKAKSMKLEQDGLNPFRDLSMPRMAMSLEQYSGRGVRTLEDRAVIGILDNRLTTTAWGRQTLGVVRGRKTQSLKEVREFHA